MKTKKKPVKAWGVYYFDRLDTDNAKWFNAQVYAVFTSRAEAVKWIGDDQSANAKIVAVHIVPLTSTKR